MNRRSLKEACPQLMPTPSIESFCERCGTKYTFEPPPQRAKRLKGLGRTLGLLSEHADQESVGLVASRDPFHGTFHFCLDCRQYTCPNCWNEVAGFCQGCVPLPESPDLGGAEAFAVLEAESALRAAAAEQRLMGQAEAWPGVDLPQPELEPEPIVEVMAEPELEYSEELEAPVELVYATAPVEVESINAQLTRTLAELNDVEPEPVVEAEFAVAPLELVAEPDPMVATAGAEPELMTVEVEAEPVLAAAEAEPEPIAGHVEPLAIEPEPESVAASATEEAAEVPAPIEVLPLAAAATDGVVEPDGLFERAWDVLYTLPATAEFAEAAPSSGDWAALESASPIRAASESDAAAVPEVVAEPEPIGAIAGMDAAAEPIATAESVAFAEPEFVAEPDVAPVTEPALVTETVAPATHEPVVVAPFAFVEPEPEPEPVVAAPVLAAEVVDEPAPVVERVAFAPPAPPAPVAMPQPVQAAAQPIVPEPVAAAPEPIVEPQPVAAAPEPIVVPQPIVPAPAPAMPIAAALPPAAPQAPVYMPAIVEPSRPTQPHLAPGWRMTAPDEPSSVWPPHAPVYRPPTPAQAQTPIHQQKNGGNQLAANAGGHAASGIRPCYNCSLPVSASARFCRRCGSAQQTTGI